MAAGDVQRVGVEGTGTYGAALTRLLLQHGLEVVEVDRPDRKVRRQKGKSDPTDAYAAALAALSGRATRDPEGAQRCGRVDPGAACGAPQRGQGTNPDH